MLVFLILCGLIAFVLQKQIANAFFANPWLNGLIVVVLLIGIILSFHQVIRLFPEVSWVNNFRRADPGTRGSRPPELLAPMAAMLGSASDVGPRRDVDADHARRSSIRSRPGSTRRATFPATDRSPGIPRPARHILGPDRNRRFGRHHHQRPESRRRRRPRCSMRSRKASPRRSAAWVFRFRRRCSVSPDRWSSASSTCRPARRRTASTPTSKTGSRPRCRTSDPARCRRPFRRSALPSSACASVGDGGSSKATPAAMANLAEAIQGLVQHMRDEQQMIRNWADEPAEQQRGSAPLHGTDRRANRRMISGASSDRWRCHRARRRDSGMNYWPGFVDALSTLVLSVIFLLTVFMVAQFFLSQEVAGKDTALQRLNAQISRISANCCRWSRPARPILKTKSRNCAPR